MKTIAFTTALAESRQGQTSDNEARLLALLLQRGRERPPRRAEEVRARTVTDTDVRTHHRGVRLFTKKAKAGCDFARFEARGLPKSRGSNDALTSPSRTSSWVGEEIEIAAADPVALGPQSDVLQNGDALTQRPSSSRAQTGSTTRS